MAVEIKGSEAEAEEEDAPETGGTEKDEQGWGEASMHGEVGVARGSREQVAEGRQRREQKT